MQGAGRKFHANYMLGGGGANKNNFHARGRGAENHIFTHGGQPASLVANLACLAQPARPPQPSQPNLG